MSYIIWKNRNSNDIKGLLISDLAPISKPKMRTMTTEIDGRDGDIVEYLGYKSYVKTISIGLTKNCDIDEIIEYFNGSGNLVLSNEPDKYYNAQIIENIDYNILINFKKANVKFYVQPFKYKLNEEKIDVSISEQTQLEVVNVGLESSKPIFTLFGSGELHFYLNSIEIFKYTFDDDEKVIIDSEKEEAYLNGVLKNRNMLGEFPLLKSGENVITWTGMLTRIIVEPRSRWL